MINEYFNTCNKSVEMIMKDNMFNAICDYKNINTVQFKKRYYSEWLMDVCKIL